ncbi:von Willebrand factor type A domain-containing protein [Penicillium canescens]|nr:von Willebrand factor type A domain-containing protein [Penicillium canescens]
MLECELGSLPDTVTVTGVTDKGEKLTAQLPLQKSGYQSGVHHLAAKALMNDYETGHSWMHAANSALRSNEPEIFDRLLEQEAQRLGQQWSIASKWTSYVAIDRDTARRHEISLWKADGVDVSELTRPRKIRTVAALPLSMTSSQSSFRSASYAPQEFRRYGGSSPAPCQGQQRSFDRPISREPANRTGSEMYPDPSRDSAGLIEYGNDPVTGSIPAEHYYGQPVSTRGAYYSPDGANAYGASSYSATTYGASTYGASTYDANTYGANTYGARRHSHGRSGGAEPRCSSRDADDLPKGSPHTMPKSSQDLNKRGPNGEISAECTDEVQSSLSIDPSVPSQSAGDGLDFRTASHAFSDPEGHKPSTGQSDVALQGNNTIRPSIFSTAATVNSSHNGVWSYSNAITSDSKESWVHNEQYFDFGPPLMSWEPQMYGASVGPVSEDNSPRATPAVPEDPTNILSLSRILYSQGADGEFRLYGTNIQRALITQFKTVIPFANQSPVSNRHHKLRSVDLNVLAVVYITTRHATLKGLWELQVAKARRWIQQQLAELSSLGDESNPPGQEFSEMALEELERMARVELLDDSEVSNTI